MARIDNLTNFLTDVATAIRTKKGTTAEIAASDFDTEIESIETGGSDITYVNTYLIKDGVFQKPYSLTNVVTYDTNASVTENYNDSKGVYIVSQTWSELTIEFDEPIEILTNSKINVDFSRPTQYSGLYSNNGAVSLKLTQNNTENTVEVVKTAEQKIRQTFTYGVEVDTTNLKIHAGNLGGYNSDNYNDYGVYIYNLWIATPQNNNIQLQEKSITITENGTQSVVADVGYTALSKVDITTNVTSSENTPSIGFVPTGWNTRGAIESGIYYGTVIPAYYFAAPTGMNISTTTTPMVAGITSIIFDSDGAIDGFGEYCFSGSSISSIVLPTMRNNFSPNTSGVGYSYGMFQNNTNLTEVTFTRESIFKTINTSDKGATNFFFKNCTKLQKVVLAPCENTNHSLYFIPGEMFSGCTSLTDLNLNDPNVGNYITSIGNSAFYNCGTLPLSSLPSNLESIDASAFYGCAALTISSFPNSLHTIGRSAFASCTNITVNFFANITSLGISAFQGCTSLTQVTALGNNTLVTIPQSCFRNCSNLAEVTMEEGVTTIDSYAFKDCTSLNSLNLPESLININTYVFENCTSLNVLNFNQNTNLSKIDNYAFNGCSNIIGIEFGEITGPLTIGIATFQNNTSLDRINIPCEVSINTKGFSGCTGIISVSLPNIISLIASSSTNGQFYNCTGLKAVWIGSTITSTNFGRYVFVGCTSLLKMYINLPRATVESFTNYQYAFMNNTAKKDIIICNDDEDFISNSTFIETDWSNYTEEV